MCLTEDRDLKKQNEKQAVRSCFFLVPCRSMEEEQESGAQGVWSLMYSSVRERSETITPSPASNGRAPTRVVNNNVLPQNHLSTPYRWNTPIDTANVAFTQEDPWGAVWGPTAQEWTQCGPHSTCCYPVTGKGRRIHWGKWLCLEPKEHLVEDWGWPDGKWMEGLLVPRQGPYGKEKM